MADDELVPKFLQALNDTGQTHIADMLRYSSRVSAGTSGNGRRKWVPGDTFLLTQKIYLSQYPIA